MIDPDWLRRVIALAEADIGGLDPVALARLLDDSVEVLPYLFVRTNGWAGWPHARQALRNAAASAVRHAPPADSAQPALKTLSFDRAALYTAVHRALTDNEGLPDHPEQASTRAHEIAALLRLADSVRIDENRGEDPPSLFITD